MRLINCRNLSNIPISCFKNSLSVSIYTSKNLEDKRKRILHFKTHSLVNGDAASDEEVDEEVDNSFVWSKQVHFAS
ncbi:hypothetical protein HanIR_Chr10g0463351 [Helianthus annuus]|nr:hypothetical protein HanIR_Chr10g0463351 [Helianthus annuus]